MPAKLPPHILEHLIQSRNIGHLSADELIRLFQNEPGIADYLPDGSFVTDPRNSDVILFNAARASRPHDNQPPDTEWPSSDGACIICAGQTTGIVDVAELSQGVTFINKNLFPVLFPFRAEQPAGPREAVASNEGGGRARGLHFLQWTSSLHDKDWHNMPAADRLVVMSRLAALEKKLIAESADLLHTERPPEGHSPAGWVLIAKNYGRLVGGSLAHGHQQIALSGIMPRRIADNERFEQSHGETFCAYMLRKNPPELTIMDYGPAVLVVPYFMRRPYDMMLLVKRSSLRYLYQLNEDELRATADGWRDATRIIRALMPAIGRETAYSILTSNGPGAGLYFEFRPYTQEFGGFEQLGLLVCQANPSGAARHIKRLLATL